MIEKIAKCVLSIEDKTIISIKALHNEEIDEEIINDFNNKLSNFFELFKKGLELEEINKNEELQEISNNFKKQEQEYKNEIRDIKINSIETEKKYKQIILEKERDIEANNLKNIENIKQKYSNEYDEKMEFQAEKMKSNMGLLEREIISLKDKIEQIKEGQEDRIEQIKEGREDRIEQIEKHNKINKNILDTQIEYFKNQLEECKNILKEKDIFINKETEKFMEVNKKLSDEINKNQDIHVQGVGKIGEVDNLELLNNSFSNNKDINFKLVASTKESGDISCMLYNYIGLIDIKNHLPGSIDRQIRRKVIDKTIRDMKLRKSNFGIIATASIQGFGDGKKDLQMEWIEGNKLLFYISGLDNDKNKICRVILLIKEILDLKERNEDMSSINTYLNMLKNMYKTLEINQNSITKCIGYSEKQITELKNIEKNIITSINDLQENNISIEEKYNSLESLTIAQLKKICDTQEIKYNSRTSKTKLLELLKE